MTSCIRAKTFIDLFPDQPKPLSGNPLAGKVVENNDIQVQGDQPIGLYLSKWKISISYNYGPSPLIGIVQKNIDAIAQRIFQDLGKNLEASIENKEIISEEFAKRIEDEIKASIVAVRRRLKHGINVEKDIALKKEPSGGIIYHQVKVEKVDRFKLKQVKKGLQDIHANTKIAYEDKPNPNPMLRENFNLQELHSLEYLAKIVSYHHNSSEPIIEVSMQVKEADPTQEPKQKILARPSKKLAKLNSEAPEVSAPMKTKMTLVRYRIEKIATIMGHSCYGLRPLTPLNAPPILLFCGTSPYPAALGAGISMISDIDPLGVGYCMYNIMRPKIRAWLEKNTKSVDGQEINKAIACGHSLGGAYATYATTYENSYIKQGYTFNGPGVSFLAARYWNKIDPALRPDLFNFNNPDDFVPKLGMKRIGNDFCTHITVQENRPKIKTWRQKKVQNHLMVVSDHTMVVVRSPIKLYYLPTWVQVAVLAPFCFSALAALISFRLVFGHSNSTQWEYLLGPVDLTFKKAYRSVLKVWNKFFKKETSDLIGRPLFV